MDDYRKYLESPIRKDRKPLHELIPLKQPLRILIDPSDVCNFRCEFCFQSKKEFKGSIMSKEVFDIIIEQLKEFDEPINVIHLYGLGEPLINENIDYFVKKLKDEKSCAEVAITTNGSLLTEKLSEKLINAGLNRLSISLNGLEDNDFNKNVVVDVNFEKIYNNIRFFYEKRKKCHLHVKINGEEFTEEQKQKFVHLFKNITDSINIDHIVNVWSGINVTENNYKMYNDSNNNDKLLTDNTAIVCPQMFYEMLIHPNGTVSPCCVDYLYNFQNLGNIYNTTIKRIWEGDLLNNIRVQNLMGGG